MILSNFFVILALTGVQAPPPAAPAQHGPSGLESDWGVRVERMHPTAGGLMLDFRFRVLDPEKAKPLFRRQTKPYLLDAVTGARLEVPRPPKTGPLRSSNEPMADRVYWMFFANPGKRVQAGDKVTVVIGDFRAENLTVQ